MRGWLLVLASCADPADKGPGAIEITGYLDASRVAWTYTGERVWAAGLEGAASAGAPLSLAGDGESAESIAGEDGAFSIALAASVGDRVTLRVEGAKEEDTRHHEVAAPAPFPATVHASATADAHLEETVSVEVELQPPRGDGQLWGLNPARPGAVSTLESHNQGALHAGVIPGAEGDALLLWFVPGSGVESEPIEVIVAPAE